MFNFLQVIGAALQVGVYAIQPQFVVINQHHVYLPETFGEVRQVEFKRLREVDDPPCLLRGVLVPYARDWEEVTETEYGRQVRPPEPNKIAGYAIVLDKKVCGNTVHPVAYVDSYFGGLFNWRMVEGLTRDANDLSLTKGDARPRWLEQVAKTLESKGYVAEAAAARVQPAPEGSAPEAELVQLEPVQAAPVDATAILEKPVPVVAPAVDLTPAM